jgi:uncharacterized OB-fold protein
VTELTDEAVFEAFPTERIDRDNIEHYRGLLAGKLLINRCSACGYWIYPHRPLCPQCLSWDVIPTEVSGQGFVFMFTLIHRERDPSTDLQELVPVVAAVELAEQTGLRYLAPIVNCPLDQVVPDMPVRLTWAERDGRLWPAFEPAIALEAREEFDGTKSAA